MLDAYTAIEDYHYGEQPPYGCQHIFVGVEEDGATKTENNNEKKDNNEKKEKELTENKNNDKIQETLEEKLKKMVQEPKSKYKYEFSHKMKTRIYLNKRITPHYTAPNTTAKHYLTHTLR